MVQTATTLLSDPSTPTGQLLEQTFEAIRQELQVRQDFPHQVLGELRRTMADPDLPERDETDVEFITIDPPGSMDLDQAMHIERAGEGWRVRYAIADVPAFIQVGGSLDQEVRLRGQTIYCPDRRVPLHPPELSESAASLLPDQTCPAYVWDMVLTADGRRESAEVYRAMVRSRRRYDYEETQRLVDSGEAEQTLLLLKEVGEARIRRELERGGASLPMPQQEVHQDGESYVLRLRPLLDSEDWNAQISLLTGMVAGQMMVDGGVGILRTMPAPEDRAVTRFRREAAARGEPWPRGMTYGEFLRTLDRTDPAHLAIINAATSLFRGAAYTAFDGELPAQAEQVQAALAAPYAHVTAPLRRLVDRYALAVCEALSAGREVPDWARAALPDLPAIMRESDQRAKAVDRACVSAVEAAVLRDRVGQTFEAMVVDQTGRGDAVVQLLDPPVSEPATGHAEVGTMVRVRVDAADVRARKVELSVVSATVEAS
ncbi:RNB domain-containing ribonuclease [Ornithinimicrobium pratense]|uniref:RNB domain-containing ribonuclease n=1 Tax=Ornithinimicrobium pratense TaxID=2593973 RepID=A0A5J6V4H4_9MICO|nr:RNB domain-containing ribonuclease [Ornithinimicrobium pratense]QFG68839.1 RNB domain-containing ribonuclease [Ornithinimicrobium pratense]